MKLVAILPALALMCTGTVFAATHGHTPKALSCKGATVYAVASSKTYYEKGETMYGHAKGGTYMCQASANAKGYHHVVVMTKVVKVKKKKH